MDPALVFNIIAGAIGLILLVLPSMLIALPAKLAPVRSFAQAGEKGWWMTTLSLSFVAFLIFYLGIARVGASLTYITSDWDAFVSGRYRPSKEVLQDLWSRWLLPGWSTCSGEEVCSVSREVLAEGQIEPDPAFSYAAGMAYAFVTGGMAALHLRRKQLPEDRSSNRPARPED